MRGYQSQLSSNPIFVRLCGRNRWIPPPFLFVLVLAVQSVITTVLAVPYLRSPIPGHDIVLMMLGGWLIVLIIPAMAAAITAAVVAQHARSEGDQLLKLTNLSVNSRVDAYIACMLYRMHLILILVALFQSWLASGVTVVRLGTQAIRYLLYCPWNDVRCSPYIDTGITPISVAIEVVLIHVVIWGLIYLAVSTGVVTGLKWRNRPSAAFLVAFSMLLLDAIVISIWTTENWNLGSPGVIGIVPLQIAISIVLYAVAFGIRRLARRWA